MTISLALDTSADACSVALWTEQGCRQCLEVAPRQHNRLIFKMLKELLPSGNLRAQGVSLLAYGCGPGSFTGLRVAASAIQGLAYASGLPVAGVSTLASQAQAVIRAGSVEEGDLILSTLDAQIGELYYACYEVRGGLPFELLPPQVSKPERVELAQFKPTMAVGNGLSLVDGNLLAQLAGSKQRPDIVPEAQDILPLAMAMHQQGQCVEAAAVRPVYVREEISWKKLAEQGVSGR